jgi:hypothetical protein
MADPADKAEKEIELQDDLMRRRIDSNRAATQGMGPLYCECGEQIPFTRRKLGLRKCIDCAWAEERGKIRTRD